MTEFWTYFGRYFPQEYYDIQSQYGELTANLPTSRFLSNLKMEMA